RPMNAPQCLGELASRGCDHRDLALPRRFTQCECRGPSRGANSRPSMSLGPGPRSFQARLVRGGGVQGGHAYMRARQVGLYAAGACVGVGLAYLLAMLPHSGRPGPDAAKAVPRKAEGRGRGGPPAPVTAASVITSDMPVILVAPGTVEPFANVAVKTRVDGP